MNKRDAIYAQTVTPGKKGVWVDKTKYELIEECIVSVLTRYGDIAFQNLPAKVRTVLAEPFDGSIGWYTTTVKLDMERRGIIERIPGIKPQRLRLVPKMQRF